MLPPQVEGEEAAVAENATEAKKPPLFRVLLHNDDYTTMEFVVFVLQTIFQKEDSEAVRIMLHVHTRGVGVAGTYTYEVAETKVSEVTALASADEYPLLCTMEQE